MLVHRARDKQMAEMSDMSLELTEADIPGASLSEPLESHAVPALK